ncbi:hypothetical protein IMCC12053_1108 [Celeribacter marinus]|uniref:Uncharacterized protein n=1 Tax=Celeribacter marinus TaxID=1397108 RepID=A0A0P0AA93_9RHOB|nr:hypothetical protein IMCC12053_1108 [Celeribacter marinus]
MCFVSAILSLLNLGFLSRVVPDIDTQTRGRKPCAMTCRISQLMLGHVAKWS